MFYKRVQLLYHCRVDTIFSFWLLKENNYKTVLDFLLDPTWCALVECKMEGMALSPYSGWNFYDSACEHSQSQPSIPETLLKEPQSIKTATSGLSVIRTPYYKTTDPHHEYRFTAYVNNKDQSKHWQHWWVDCLWMYTEKNVLNGDLDYFI